MRIPRLFRLKRPDPADIVPAVHPPGLCRKVRSLTAGFLCAKPRITPLYCKPPLSYEEQADLILRRGMAGGRDGIIERLKVVGYYRLSGYWYSFRELPSDDFKPGTHFDVVWNRYVFDRRLRLLVLDAIERFEIALRTRLAYHHSHAHGPFAYAEDPTSLPGLKGEHLTGYIEAIQEETKRSKEPFVRHFRTKYGAAHDYLPIWSASELFSFGTLVTIFNSLAKPTRRAVAAEFNVADKVLASWLLTLNSVRNICAHHQRLWNRELPIAPTIPKRRHSPEWHTPESIPNDRVFGVLSICRYLLKTIAPSSNWNQRLLDLLAEFPEIPVEDMDFIENWQRHAIWRD